MLRTFFRIGMILLVASLVAGGVYWYAVRAGSDVSAVPGEGEGHSFGQLEQGAFSETERPMRGNGLGGGQGWRRAGERGEEGFSMDGWESVLEQAGKIGLITLSVLGIQAIVRRIQRGHRRRVDQPRAV
jgi:hypothetical protein